MSFFDGTDREKEEESVCVVQVHRNRIELHLMYLIRMMLPLLACC